MIHRRIAILLVLALLFSGQAFAQTDDAQARKIVADAICVTLNGQKIDLDASVALAYDGAKVQGWIESGGDELFPFQGWKDGESAALALKGMTRYLRLQEAGVSRISAAETEAWKCAVERMLLEFVLEGGLESVEALLMENIKLSSGQTQPAYGTILLDGTQMECSRWEYRLDVQGVRDVLQAILDKRPAFGAFWEQNEGGDSAVVQSGGLDLQIVEAAQGEYLELTSETTLEEDGGKETLSLDVTRYGDSLTVSGRLADGQGSEVTLNVEVLETLEGAGSMYMDLTAFLDAAAQQDGGQSGDGRGLTLNVYGKYDPANAKANAFSGKMRAWETVGGQETNLMELHGQVSGSAAEGTADITFQSANLTLGGSFHYRSQECGALEDWQGDAQGVDVETASQEELDSALEDLYARFQEEVNVLLKDDSVEKLVVTYTLSYLMRGDEEQKSTAHRFDRLKSAREYAYFTIPELTYLPQGYAFSYAEVDNAQGVAWLHFSDGASTITAMVYVPQYYRTDVYFLEEDGTCVPEDRTVAEIVYSQGEDSNTAYVYGKDVSVDLYLSACVNSQEMLRILQGMRFDPS